MKIYTYTLGQAVKKKRTSKIKKLIKNNKFLSVVVGIFLISCTLNFVLIYNFMLILEKISK